jgi:hypothetical protein
MPYTNDYNHNRSKEGSRDTHKSTTQQQHAHKQKRAQIKTTESELKNELKSLSTKSTAWLQRFGVVLCSKGAWLIAPCA